MSTEETEHHVVSVPGENREQSNKGTISNLVNRWRNLFKSHASTERKAILLLSVAAVFWDPFFFYIPVVKNASTCLGVDNNLRIIVVFFRSSVDTLHTILWCRNSLPLVHGQHRLILAWTVAILATLPLPQVVILAVPWQPLTVRMLKFIVLIQFAIRLCRIIPAYRDATRSSDMLYIFTWFAATFNLIMYTLASNVLGAFWYLCAIERNMDCWRKACHKNQTLCDGSSLYCDDTTSYKEYLHEHCLKPQALGNYGIYKEAFQIIEKDTHFLEKYFHCFWWGFQSLSSLGQDLKTSTYIWDSIFVIFIAICGLVLFAFLIGNMQTFLQTKTLAKLERMKQRRNDLEGWKPFSLLPPDLKQEVTWCEDPKWHATTEVNLESLLNNTPRALQEKLKPHLCKDMLEKIPQFKNLGDQQKQELRDLAKPVVFLERSYIFKEGEPILEVVFIVYGNLWSYNKHSTQNRILAEQLSAGSFFGEELLQPLELASGLPIASKTIQAATKVEALAIPANDLISTYGRWA